MVFSTRSLLADKVRNGHLLNYIKSYDYDGNNNIMLFKLR